MKGIPSGRIRKKQDLIRAALENGLNDTNRMLVRDALEFLDNLESKIEKLSHEVLKKIQQKSKDLAIVMSIPGIGFVSASVILSEIGNYRDFQTPDQLAKWCGLKSWRKRICRQEEKTWNHKEGFQARQSCAGPSCADHSKYEKDKAIQILPEID